MFEINHSSLILAILGDVLLNIKRILSNIRTKKKVSNHCSQYEVIARNSSSTRNSKIKNKNNNYKRKFLNRFELWT